MTEVECAYYKCLYNKSGICKRKHIKIGAIYRICVSMEEQ